jgi:GT2 family glycosyltransferase
VLAFIDADCIADPGWLAAIAAAIGGGAQVIGGDVRIALADPARLTMLEAYESIFAYRQQEYIERQGFSGTGNLAMRREVYDAVGPFAGIEVAEDRDWGHRATALGYRIAWVPEMVVFHPARRSLSELYAKWDRHVAHDYEEYVHGLKGRLWWLGMTLAVLGSPILELVRIARSKRVGTVRERMLTLRALTTVRFYRAVRMVELLAKGRSASRSGTWNRR